MNLAHWLARSARRDGPQPAVLLGETVLHDYASLARRAASLGDALLRRFGLARGDRVALFMSNHPAVLEAMFGCWWAGLAVVPVNAKLHPLELHYIVEHSEASLLLVTRDVGDALGALPSMPPSLKDTIAVDAPAWERLVESGTPGDVAERAPDDLAWLFYTSGTTGRPKGVAITQRNLQVMTLGYFTDVDTAAAGDAWLYAAPMSHGAGLYGLPHVVAGARHVVPESRGFDAAEILQLARRLRDVSMFAAPTMVRRLVEQAAVEGADGDGLKTVVYGGGPMYVEDIQRALQVMGPRFVQIYGQGESPMTITALARAQIADRTHPRWLERLGSVGVAQACVELRVADADGRPLPAGETGEVLVRGDCVMAGYWRDPEASARTVRDGWLYTGDVGSLDADGFLTLRDRSKDVIISGGSNIYPREVEEVLLRHPSVAEVSVVGRRDAEWGEVVVAFVVPRAGATIDGAALDALCQASIARFKRPREYRVLDALPKNHYGKVLKTELRRLLSSA